MWRFAVVAMVLLMPVTCALGAGVDDLRIFKRGDANNDNQVNVSDAVYMNNYLYQGGPQPPCLNQADVNDDARFDGSDPAFLLSYLYQGGSAPPWPGPANTVCTYESNDYIGCANPCD